VRWSKDHRSARPTVKAEL